VRLAFLLFLLFFGCLETKTPALSPNINGTIAEMLDANVSVFCKVMMNDELGNYEAQLWIEKGNYWLEFRVKNNPAEIIYSNGTYFEKIGEKWLKFTAKSFELAKGNGAFDPSFVLNIPKTNLNCSLENVRLKKPENYTDYDKIFEEMLANESKIIEEMNVDCDLFIFIDCDAFENGSIRDACEYCKSQEGL